MVKDFTTLAACLVGLCCAVPLTAHGQDTVLLLPLNTDADVLSATAVDATLRRDLEAHGYRVLEAATPLNGASTPRHHLALAARTAGAAYVVEPTLETFAGMTSFHVRIADTTGRVVGEAREMVHQLPATPRQASRLLGLAMQTLPGGAPPMASPPPPPPGLASPWQGETSPPQVATPTLEEPRGRRPAQPSLRFRRRQGPDWPDRHFSFGPLFEPGTGTNRSAFSLMTGLRGEFTWAGFVASLNVHYAFVKDYEPRTNPDYHTLTLYGMAGYKIRLGSPRFFLPLLAGAGWIPGNGALVRLEAGLAFRLADRVELRTIFVCPNFWIMKEATVFFTTLSLALLVGF
jgi:hypothetical protein